MPQSLEIAIWVTAMGTVIGIIGFFVKKLLDRNEESITALTSAIHDLSDIMQEFRTEFTEFRGITTNRVRHVESNCKDIHDVLEHHGKDIINIDKRVTVIETDHRRNH